MRVDSGKFLSVGVLVLISTLAVNGATSKEAAIVKDVSFQNNGDILEAKITASDVNPNDASSDERSMSDAKPQNAPSTDWRQAHLSTSTR